MAVWRLGLRVSLLALAALVLAACSVTRVAVDEPVAAARASGERAEDQLLDVWIALFDPGELPGDEDEARGLTLDIRKAEARYMPQQLRDTLERSGYWGAVRVVPRDTDGGEVLVDGTIVDSDGERLELVVRARDARGVEWFSRHYKAEATLEDYRRAQSEGVEVFQPLYNTIANDLAAFLERVSVEDIARIRRTAELQFAGDLAPDAFGDYLQTDAQGGVSVQRLPALEDPMYRRVSAIRERDFLLIDTLNGHFANFHADMQTPYRQWRMSRLEELEAMREIQREARNRKLLGAATILGAIGIEVLGGDSTRRSTGTLRNVMVVGGAYVVKTGFDRASEATIHSDAIAELGESFAAETRPMVVDVEGQTHELTGSAETQYQQWRALLRRIYAAETGLPAAETP